MDIVNDRFYRHVWLSAATGSLLLLATGLFLGTIGIDDEIHLIGHSYSGIGRGLWGHEFFTYLLPGQLGITFAPMVVGIILYAASTTILIYLWQLRDPVVANLAAFSIGSFPYFAAMMTFDVVQVSYPLGFICIILSLYPVFSNRGILYHVVGILLFTVAFSLYQGVACTYVTAFVSIIGMRFAMSDEKDKSFADIYRHILPRILTQCSVGSAVYLYSTKFFKDHLPHESWEGSYDVAVNIQFWEPIRLQKIIRNILEILVDGRHELPGTAVASFFILLTILSVSTLFLVRITLWKRLVLFGTVWVSTTLCPFGLLLVQTTPMASRSSVGLGILYAFVFAALTVHANLLGRRLLMAVVSLWCFQFIFLGNQMYYTQYLTYMTDRDTANRIVNRIDNLPGVERLAYPVPVSFAGRNIQPDNGLERYWVHGHSVFGWYESGDDRPKAFFKLINIQGLDFEHAVKRDKLVQFVDEAKVPSWPQRGSVFIFDDQIVVVNLGSNTNLPNRGAMKAPANKLYRFLCRLIRNVYSLISRLSAS